jgi:hypothetical protein
MPQASITVQYVNPPKEGSRAPGKIKTSDGQYYKVWKDSKHGGPCLTDFSEGQTYDIEYKEEEPYNGKAQYMVTKINSASTSKTTNGTNGHDASAAFRGQDDKSAEIKWMASQKVAALLFVGTKDVDGCMMAARFIYNEPADVVAEAKRLFNATEAEPLKEAF